MKSFWNHIARILINYQRWIIGAVLVIVFIVGLVTYRDYGFSWDEAISHGNGQVALKYVRDGDPALWTYSERYYGTLFEMPFALYQDMVGFNSSQELFFFRHIITFTVFLIGVWVFYRFCLKRFKNAWLPLVGCIFLIVSPRIFADAFYNSKDIPFMVFFIVAMVTMVRFLEKPDWKRALIHGLATGALIALRLPGLVVPALTACFLLLDLLLSPQARALWFARVRFVAIYGVACVGFTILLWPFLWQQPLTHFLEAFADMSRFSRQVGLLVLHFGEFIKASQLPWNYIPVWIFITTPLSYAAFFLMGLGVTAWSFIRRFKATYQSRRMDLVVLAWLFAPLCAVIILNSVLYDGWRHLYFIYPAFIYISLVGAQVLIDFLKKMRGRLRATLAALAAGAVMLNVAFVIAFMVRNHPYQNLYFNGLVGGIESARRNFDLDYWGLTFRQGLEYIAAHDTDSKIPVTLVMGSPYTLLILDQKIQDRFEILTTEYNQAKYILSNYRWQEYDKLPHDKEVYAVTVDGVKVMSVFKMK